MSAEKEKSIKGALLFVVVCSWLLATQMLFGFHLMTFLYPEEDVQRASEYCLCLEENCNNPAITSITIFFDIEKDAAWDKATSEGHRVLLGTIERMIQSETKAVKIVEQVGRPTYAECYRHVRAHTDAVIIANADIYFDDTLMLLDEDKLENVLIGLTRWNLLPDGTKEFFRKLAGRSQDAWIFKVPCPFMEKAHIELGTPHCEGRLMFLARQSRIKLLNFSLDIKAIHVHNSQKRNYRSIPVNHSVMSYAPLSRLDDAFRNFAVEPDGKRVRIYTCFTPAYAALYSNWFLESVPADLEVVSILCTEENEETPVGVQTDGTYGPEKVGLILRAIEDNWGGYFVYSASDVQFFREFSDYIPALLRDHDIAFQANDWLGRPCSDFFMCKANEETRSLWMLVKELLDTHPNDPGYNDQACLELVLGMRFNTHFHSSLEGLNWRILPTHLFFGGGTFSNLEWRPGRQLPLPADPIAHHANFTAEITDKPRQLEYVKDWVIKNDRQPVLDAYKLYEKS